MINISKKNQSYFRIFYQDILKLWRKYYSNQPSLPSTISFQYMCFNGFVKIGNKVVFHKKFSEKNINFIKCLINPFMTEAVHIFQLSQYERETPDFRARLPPSRQF